MPSRLDMQRPWTSYEILDHSWSPMDSQYTPAPGYYRSMYAQPERHIPDYLPPVSPNMQVPSYQDNYKRQYDKQKWANKRLDGPPRLRSGRLGAPWRHIKQTTGHSGSNIMFIEGTVKQDDAKHFPPYGWDTIIEPPSSRVYTYSSPIMHHYGTLGLKGHQSKLNRYDNSFQQHARNGFKYWYEEKKPPTLGNHLTIHGRQLILGEAR